MTRPPTEESKLDASEDDDDFEDEEKEALDSESEEEGPVKKRKAPAAKAGCGGEGATTGASLRELPVGVVDRLAAVGEGAEKLRDMEKIIPIRRLDRLAPFGPEAHDMRLGWADCVKNVLAPSKVASIVGAVHTQAADSGSQHLKAQRVYVHPPSATPMNVFGGVSDAHTIVTDVATALGQYNKTHPYFFGQMLIDDKIYLHADDQTRPLDVHKYIDRFIGTTVTFFAQLPNTPRSKRVALEDVPGDLELLCFETKPLMAVGGDYRAFQGTAEWSGLFHGAVSVPSSLDISPEGSLILANDLLAWLAECGGASSFMWETCVSESEEPWQQEAVQQALLKHKASLLARGKAIHADPAFSFGLVHTPDEVREMVVGTTAATSRFHPRHAPSGVGNFTGYRTHGGCPKGKGSHAHYSNAGEGSRAHHSNSGEGSRVHYSNSGEGSRAHQSNSGEGSRAHYSNSGKGSRAHHSMPSGVNRKAMTCRYCEKKRPGLTPCGEKSQRKCKYRNFQTSSASL